MRGLLLLLLLEPSAAEANQTLGMTFAVPCGGKTQADGAGIDELAIRRLHLPPLVARWLSLSVWHLGLRQLFR